MKKSYTKKLKHNWFLTPNIIILMFLIIVIGLTIINLSKPMIWRGEAATDTLRLNNMQVQAGYEVINESSCNGFCTPWDDRRGAQCKGNLTITKKRF